MPSAYAISIDRPHEAMGLPMSTSKKALQFSQSAWLTLMAVVTVACMGNYIYQVNSTATRGFALRNLEKRVDLLNEEVVNMQDKVVQMHAMQTVEQRVQDLGYVPVRWMEFLGQKTPAIVAAK